MRMGQGKGGVQKRGRPEDLLHLPRRARSDLAATFHRVSKEMATCEHTQRAISQADSVRPA
jgi:hypothetical protein